MIAQTSTIGDLAWLPHLVGEPAILRRPSDEPDAPFDVPSCNLALPLWLRFRPCRLTRLLSFGTRQMKLSECLGRSRFRGLGARRGTKLGHGALRRDDRGLTGVKNDPLRQFPIGLDADGGRGTGSAVSSGPIRKTGIRNEEQREQRTADIKQISR
ncbi:hypothetical protein [Bradyrhizobium barranii]